MSQEDIQMLLDRAAISDILHAYATGLDRRNWELHRSAFIKTIEMDFSSLGLGAGTYEADEWVSQAKRLFAGLSATQHTSTNHVHDIRGDEATCISNMQAEHFVAREPDDGLDEGSDRWTVGGYYINELVRTPVGWKLAKVTLMVTWQTGNRDISRIALQRARALESNP